MKSLHKTEEKENYSKIFLGKVYPNFAAAVAFAELGLSLHSSSCVPAARGGEGRSPQGGMLAGWDAGRAGCPRLCVSRAGRGRDGSSLPPSRHGN